jgi:hypothetical protein
LTVHIVAIGRRFRPRGSTGSAELNEWIDRARLAENLPQIAIRSHETVEYGNNRPNPIDAQSYYFLFSPISFFERITWFSDVFKMAGVTCNQLKILIDCYRRYHGIRNSERSSRSIQIAYDASR